VALADVPVIDVAAAFAQQGIVTGASGRNWAAYGASVALPSGAQPWQQAMVSDPQTSGGLLVSCAPQAVDAVLAAFHADGFAEAAVVGTLQAGAAEITFV